MPVGLVAGVVVLVVVLVGLVVVVRHRRESRPEVAAGDKQMSISSGGLDRTYAVHVPPGYTPDEPVPLMLVLHGGGGDAGNAQHMTGMNQVSDEGGFLAVYPDGTGRLRTWNAGSCCGAAQRDDVDDVGFIRDVITKMEQDYSVDPKRIYVTGMSNGGMMTYRIGCELSDTVAAIAPVSGALNTDCSPSQPVSTIVFHGTADTSVPYDGGTPTGGIGNTGDQNSVANAVGFWSNEDGCSSVADEQVSTNVTLEEHTGCDPGTEVELYTIKGGGHAWPGGEKGSRRGDTPTDEISASELIWQFMEAHPKP